MPPFVPYAPGAYNWWEGNTFRIPALGQYARPSYAEALAPVVNSDPTLAAAVPGAVDPRFSDAGRGYGEGTGYGVQNGQQQTREANSFGDLVGSAGRGIAMMSGPIGLGLGLANMAMKGEPVGGYSWRDVIPGKGIYDAVQGVRDYFGGGSDFEAYSGGGGRASGAPETLGGLSEYDMSLATGDTGDPAPGVSSGPTPGDPTQGEGPAYLAKGGRVMPRHLAGPNPPGPDDGLAYLDVGEHVINAKQAAKHRGLLDAINKGKVSKKKARGLLD